MPSSSILSGLQKQIRLLYMLLYLFLLVSPRMGISPQPPIVMILEKPIPCCSSLGKWERCVHFYRGGKDLEQLTQGRDHFSIACSL